MRTSCLVLAMALLAGQGAVAVTVYQWKDAEGLVHFSDTPPPDETSAAINEIEMADLDGNNADPDKYSIVNQLEQMTAWRRQEEEAQRAWKQLELEEERLAREQESRQAAADASTDTIYPVLYYPAVNYYPYPIHIPRHKHRHGRHVPDNHFSLDIKGRRGQLSLGFGQQLMKSNLVMTNGQ